jgi:hypothetical protein
VSDHVEIPRKVYEAAQHAPAITIAPAHDYCSVFVPGERVEERRAMRRRQRPDAPSLHLIAYEAD